jgi:hypothetical protein
MEWFFDGYSIVLEVMERVTEFAMTGYASWV